MWPWRHNVPKRATIWLKLFFISLLLHSSMLFLIFVSYRGYYAQLHVSIRKPDVPVIFMPLQKSIHIDNLPHKKQIVAQHRKQATNIASNMVQVQQQKKNNPIKKSMVLAQEEKKSAQLQKNTKNIQKNKSTTNKQQSNQPKKLPKKIIKDNSNKKEDSVLKPSVQSAEKKIDLGTEEKIVAKQLTKKCESSNEERASTKNTINPLPTDSDHQPMKEENSIAEKPVCVGQVEWDALQIQEYIQHEIEQQWKPPVGLANELACQISIRVGWDGSAKEVKLLASSGILAYDIHARNTSYAIHFPKAAWGKELIIHFKQ